MGKPFDNDFDEGLESHEPIAEDQSKAAAEHPEEVRAGIPTAEGEPEIPAAPVTKPALELGDLETFLREQIAAIGLSRDHRKIGILMNRLLERYR